MTQWNDNFFSLKLYVFASSQIYYCYVEEVDKKLVKKY